MNISEKFANWPERAIISVRLHLYDSTSRERCDLNKLVKVFKLANEHGIQEPVSTNLNKLNAVYVELDNFVLRNRSHRSANPEGWGNHWGFLLALVEAFPEDVYIDSPKETLDYNKGLRFCLAAGGNIAEEIETDDSMC